MTPNYISRIMTGTKQLKVLLEHLQQDPEDYSEDIEELEGIIAERTLMALIKGEKTEE